MKILFLNSFLIFWCCSFATYAQLDSLSNEKVFSIVEEPPHPVGGLQALYKELATIQRYPEDAKKQKVEGRVFLELVIYKDGSLSDIKVIRGLTPSCDEEAIRAIKLTKKWVPGKQNGKVVKSKFNLAVIFKLPKS
jgi:periplasmic protein TonB